MLRFTFRSLVAVALAGCAVSAAAGDLTITFKSVNNGKVSTTTDYMTTNKMRMVDGDRDTILDTGQAKITMIDHGKKEYSEITAAEIEAAAGGMSDKMAKAQAQQAEAMKNMPPAIREKMAKLMGSGPGGMGSFTVTKGTQTKQVAGYPTQQFTLTMGEMGHTEMWVTKAIVPPLQPGEMARLAQSLNPMLSKAAGASMEEFKKIDGLTLASVTTIKMMGKTMESSKEATEIKTDALPASTFAIPAGYKKVESPLAKLGR